MSRPAPSQKPKPDWRLLSDNITLAFTRTPKEAIGALIGDFLPNMKYMSLDALKNLAYGAIEMLKEARAPSRDYTNLKKAADRLLPSTEAWMIFLTNTFLASEGRGLLNGYGMGKFEGTWNNTKRCIATYACNPERNSIYDEYKDAPMHYTRSRFTGTTLDPKGLRKHRA